MIIDFVDGSVIVPSSAVRVEGAGGSALDISGIYTVVNTSTTVRIRNWFLPAGYDVTFDFETQSLGVFVPTGKKPVLVYQNRIYLIQRTPTGLFISIHKLNGEHVNIVEFPPTRAGRLAINQCTLGIINNLPVLCVTYNQTSASVPFVMEVYKISDVNCLFMFEETIFLGPSINVSSPSQMIFNYGYGNVACTYYAFGVPDLPQAVWCSTGEYFINTDNITLTRDILPSKNPWLQPIIFMQNTDAPNATHGGTTSFVSPMVTSLGSSSGFRMNTTTRIMETVLSPRYYCGTTKGLPYSLWIPKTIIDNITGALITVPNVIAQSPWNNGAQFGFTFLIGGLYYLFYASFDWGDKRTQLVNNYTRLI